MAVLRDGDYIKQIVSYIERNSSRGYSIDQMRFTLLQQGYSRAAIEKAMRIYEQSRPRPVEVKKEEIPAVEPVVSVQQKKGFFSRMFGFFMKE